MSMGLINLIQKLFNKSNNEHDDEIKEDCEFYNENYDKHQELLKQSTQYKKDNNLGKAIETIYTAIAKYPIEDDSKSYFKIAYYYQLQEKWDESWNIYQEVMGKLNPNDPIKYAWLISDVLEEQVKQLKREKNIKEYLYHFSLSQYATLVCRALNGVEGYVEHFYNNIEQFYEVSLLKDILKKKEFIDINKRFIKSKEEKIFTLLNYTKSKTYQMMDKNILLKLLKDLHHLELSNYYNSNYRYN